MTTVAIYPQALQTVCQEYVNRKMREFRRNRSVLIGKTMNPEGLRKLFFGRKSESEALRSLYKAGGKLEQLRAELMQCIERAAQWKIVAEDSVGPVVLLPPAAAAEFSLELQLNRKGVLVSF